MVSKSEISEVEEQSKRGKRNKVVHGGSKEEIVPQPVWTQRRCLGEAGIAGSCEQQCQSELGVSVEKRGHSSVSGVGGSQKQRKAVVEKKVGRFAGVRVVSAERRGRGPGREQGVN